MKNLIHVLTIVICLNFVMCVIKQNKSDIIIQFLQGKASIVSDYDNDGDLDVLFVNKNKIMCLMKKGKNNNWELIK